MLDVKMTILPDTTIPVDSMTQVLNHARKITCAGVRRMRGVGVVFTKQRVRGDGRCFVCSTAQSEGKVHAVRLRMPPGPRSLQDDMNRWRERCACTESRKHRHSSKT